METPEQILSRKSCRLEHGDNNTRLELYERESVLYMMKEFGIQIHTKYKEIIEEQERLIKHFKQHYYPVRSKFSDVSPTQVKNITRKMEIKITELKKNE